MGHDDLRVEVVPSDQLPQLAAQRLADLLRTAVAARGRATFAVSGGRTPGRTLRELARLELPWASLELLQVDERIAADGDTARNLVGLRRDLLELVPLPAAQVHPMPVGAAAAVDAGAAVDGGAQVEAGAAVDVGAAVDGELALDAGTAAHEAADRYADQLRQLAGDPPTLDVVQLGLGDDGHTASLVPGDPALDVLDRPVAVTGSYRGHRRLTLTLPVLDRARTIVWIVTGADKADALAHLRAGDPSIPASRVRRERAVVIADEAAAGGA